MTNNTFSYHFCKSPPIRVCKAESTSGWNVRLTTFLQNAILPAHYSTTVYFSPTCLLTDSAYFQLSTTYLFWVSSNAITHSRKTDRGSKLCSFSGSWSRLLSKNSFFREATLIPSRSLSIYLIMSTSVFSISISDLTDYSASINTSLVIWPFEPKLAKNLRNAVSCLRWLLPILFSIRKQSSILLFFVPVHGVLDTSLFCLTYTAYTCPLPSSYWYLKPIVHLF